MQMRQKCFDLSPHHIEKHRKIQKEKERKERERSKYEKREREREE